MPFLLGATGGADASGPVSTDFCRRTGTGGGAPPSVACACVSTRRNTSSEKTPNTHCVHACAVALLQSSPRYACDNVAPSRCLCSEPPVCLHIRPSVFGLPALALCVCVCVCVCVCRSVPLVSHRSSWSVRTCCCCVGGATGAFFFFPFFFGATGGPLGGAGAAPRPLISAPPSAPKRMVYGGECHASTVH